MSSINHPLNHILTDHILSQVEPLFVRKFNVKSVHSSSHDLNNTTTTTISKDHTSPPDPQNLITPHHHHHQQNMDETTTHRKVDSIASKTHTAAQVHSSPSSSHTNNHHHHHNNNTVDTLSRVSHERSSSSTFGHTAARYFNSICRILILSAAAMFVFFYSLLAAEVIENPMADATDTTPT